MKAKILARRFLVTWETMRGCWGQCDPPDKPHKAIRLHPKLKESGRDELLLDTVIHEATHAAQWHVSEEYVTEFSSDVARLLYRLGFRRIHELDQTNELHK